MSYAAEKVNPIIPHIPELIVGAIAFAVVVYVLGRFVWPRMEATFQARVDAIEGGIKRAEEAQAEANKVLEQYRQQLAEARTEAARIRDEARADAVAIREDLLAKAAEERDRIIAAGEERLAPRAARRPGQPRRRAGRSDRRRLADRRGAPARHHRTVPGRAGRSGTGRHLGRQRTQRSGVRGQAAGT